MLNRLIHTVWEPVEILASSLRSRRWLDILLLFGIFGFLFGFLQVGQEWTAFMRPQFEIDLSPWALPRYTFYTMTRGLLAYLLSLGFTFVYAYWVAKMNDRKSFSFRSWIFCKAFPLCLFIAPAHCVRPTVSEQQYWARTNGHYYYFYVPSLEHDL